MGSFSAVRGAMILLEASPARSSASVAPATRFRTRCTISISTRTRIGHHLEPAGADCARDVPHVAPRFVHGLGRQAHAPVPADRPRQLQRGALAKAQPRLFCWKDRPDLADCRGAGYRHRLLRGAAWPRILRLFLRAPHPHALSRARFDCARHASTASRRDTSRARRRNAGCRAASART